MPTAGARTRRPGPEEDTGRGAQLHPGPRENTRKNFQAIQDSTKASTGHGREELSPSNKSKVQPEPQRVPRKEIQSRGRPSRPPAPVEEWPHRPVPASSDLAPMLPGVRLENLSERGRGERATASRGLPPPTGRRRGTPGSSRTPVTPSQPPRKPTDQLDELAAKQLQEMVPSPARPDRERQRGAQQQQQRAAKAEERDLVEDDSSDDEGPVPRTAPSGQCEEIPSLVDLLPHRTSTSGPLEPPQTSLHGGGQGQAARAHGLPHLTIMAASSNG